MNKKEALRIYKDTRKKINAYALLLTTTYYDRLTIAPKKGSEYRNEMLSFMDGELFDIYTNKEFIDAVLYLSELKLEDPLKRDIYLSKKSLETILKFSKEEQVSFSLLQMKGNDVWEKAKNTDNYKSFEPYLKQLFEVSIKRAKKRNPNAKPYNVVLDDYEEGMDIDTYDKFFDLVKKELVPLIKKINNKQNMIDDSFLYKYYPKDRQEKFLIELNKYLNYDKSWGYMGVSKHPFTNGISSNDVRITTYYDEYNITSAIFSVIHEVGHAFYEHQVDIKYQGSRIAEDISSGMHESQSRFLENYLGRRKSFWVNLYPKLQKLFPENLGDISLDQFIKAINVSRSSFVRTDADELTYPLHILVRYEIEKGIFANKISTNNLNKTWNEMYKKYLGIEVRNDVEGILQDTHWSDASFGYFPTYALGSAIGAQILKKMEKDLDIDYLLENKKFKTITNYLKNNIQKYGALYDYQSILKMYTGERFNPKYYINYLKKKYSKLYDIKL